MIFRPAGPTADAIAEMGIVLVVVASLIFVLVMGLLALALRRRPPERWQASTTLWVVGGGFVLPVIVLSALLVYTTVRSHQLTPKQNADGLVVAVTGHMWWWEVRYRDPASGLDVMLANEIRLPAGRALTLGLGTADVIHSFWVPQLAGKVDMVPGRVHQLRVIARETGVFRGQCAEYCGEQHARMALHVVVETPEQFDRWLAAQARPAAAPREPLAQQGRQVFIEQRCNACHTVRGVAEESRLGPDLTHVGSRLYIGAGMLPTDRDALARWVAYTQRVKPGARMPSHEQLDGASLRALAAFLAGLQ